MSADDVYERRGSIYVPSRRRNHQLLAVDLFCGCGGFSLGMQQAGINVIAAAEWWPTAAITYLVNLGSRGGCAIGYVTDEDRRRFSRELLKMQAKKQLSVEGWVGANNPHHDGSGCRAMIIGDVAKVTAGTIHETLAGIGIRDCQIDVVFGGPPCQGFSRAGKQDPTDPRNNMVLEFWRIADELGVSCAAMENVPPLLTEAKFRPLFDALVERANAAGFAICANVLDAANYGVPQFRRRAFVVGTRGDDAQPFQFPMPTHWPFVATPDGQRTKMGFFGDDKPTEAKEPDDAQQELFANVYRRKV